MSKVIAITGGPCAGKTSALEELRRLLGDDACYVAESATDLIMQGVAPWTCPTMLDFQTQVIALQLKREAAAAASSRALIVCDRGVPDSRAYLTADEYARALASNGLDEHGALARYDAVIHLESVAKADPGAYTRANNAARFENAAEAALADDRVVAAWRMHPSVHLIRAEQDFETKVAKLADLMLRLSRGNP